MPNEPGLPQVVNLNSLSLEQGLITPFQPVTIRFGDGGLANAYYAAGPAEFIGSMPIRHDLVTLSRETQELANVGLPNDPIIRNHDQQVGPVDANFWGRSDWIGEAPPIQFGQGLGIHSGDLYNGETPRQDITFYTRNQTEALRIADNGDFFVQGRLMKNDLEIYQAFRKFLGLSYEESPPSEPKPRDGVETRYQRIRKKLGYCE